MNSTTRVTSLKVFQKRSLLIEDLFQSFPNLIPWKKLVQFFALELPCLLHWKHMELIKVDWMLELWVSYHFMYRHRYLYEIICKKKMWKFLYSFCTMAIFYFLNWIHSSLVIYWRDETFEGMKLLKGGNGT
mgnify:CR=1 FL=1